MPDTVCGLRTRPPELFGLKPFHANAAITSPFHGIPSVVYLTAPLDGVQPTWRVKSISRGCVEPTR
jgi:hypothetical protein